VIIETDFAAAVACTTSSPRASSAVASKMLAPQDDHCADNVLKLYLRRADLYVASGSAAGIRPSSIAAQKAVQSRSV
jgi:hypothetical protein